MENWDTLWTVNCSSRQQNAVSPLALRGYRRGRAKISRRAERRLGVVRHLDEVSGVLDGGAGLLGAAEQGQVRGEVAVVQDVGAVAGPSPARDPVLQNTPPFLLQTVPEPEQGVSIVTHLLHKL